MQMYFQRDNSKQQQFISINTALTQTNIYEPQAVATMQTRHQLHGLDKKKEENPKLSWDQ